MALPWKQYLVIFIGLEIVGPDVGNGVRAGLDADRCLARVLLAHDESLAAGAEDLGAGFVVSVQPEGQAQGTQAEPRLLSRASLTRLTSPIPQCLQRQLRLP